jgi:hypothetical protein
MSREISLVPRVSRPIEVDCYRHHVGKTGQIVTELFSGSQKISIVALMLDLEPH